MWLPGLLGRRSELRNGRALTGQSARPLPLLQLTMGHVWALQLASMAHAQASVAHWVGESAHGACSTRTRQHAQLLRQLPSLVGHGSLWQLHHVAQAWWGQQAGLMGPQQIELPQVHHQLVVGQLRRACKAQDMPSSHLCTTAPELKEAARLPCRYQHNTQPGNLLLYLPPKQRQPQVPEDPLLARVAYLSGST